MTRPTARSLHRLLSPVLFILVGVSALTGLAYRVGRKWLGIDGQTGQAIMEIHTGEWLGDQASPFYVLLAGAALLFLLFTGFSMLAKGRPKGAVRLWHRVLGGILLLPLAATAITGMIYQAGHSWFSISEKTSDLLMTIHEGAWLGKNLKVYYVLVTGLGLLALGVSGLVLRLPKKRVPAARQ